MNIIAVIVLSCANAPVMAQSAQSFQPTVLIQAKQGMGPGEFAGRSSEDSPLIMGPVVDDQEHIYILAPLNNCLQSYDSSGKYWGCIPIQASSMPDEYLRKAGHDELDSDILSFGAVNNAVYALKALSGPVEHLFRLEDKSFVNDDADLPKIRGKLVHRGDAAQRLKSALTQLGMTKQQFEARYFDKGLSDALAGIYWDARNNMWVVSSRAIKVYSPAGSLIYEKKAVVIWGGHVFSKRGNLYVIEYVPSGIRVLKYSLQGK